MKRPLAGDDQLPEADRFLEAPHPRETARVLGHADAQRALLETYAGGRMHHAWIISGQPGIGKATLAYAVAKFLAANPDAAADAAQAAMSLDTSDTHPLVRQIKAGAFPDIATVRRSWVPERKTLSGEIRVDDIRRATHLFEQTAIAGGWRVAIIDSVDEMNTNAANALLKMLEEPPARSLFLLISHAPGRLLPTIRSRCRMLHLKPLPAEIVAAITLGLEPWADIAAERHHEAAALSDGSVREAIKLLDEDTAAFRRRIAGLLAALPRIDHKAVRDLAQAVDGRAGAENMELLRLAVEDFLTDQVRKRTAEGPGALAPLAEVWEKLTQSVREADIYNLDRRPLVIALFASLAEAVPNHPATSF